MSPPSGRNGERGNDYGETVRKKLGSIAGDIVTDKYVWWR
jgi:hypothetical protein